MMIYKTAPENVAAKVISISNITPTRLAEMGLKAHALGAELDPDYGEFPTWLRDRVAQDFPLMIAGTPEQPVWSDDKCPICGGVYGVNPNLAPNSTVHMACAWSRAESLTHDDSKESAPQESPNLISAEPVSASALRRPRSLRGGTRAAVGNPPAKSLCPANSPNPMPAR